MARGKANSVFPFHAECAAALLFAALFISCLGALPAAALASASPEVVGMEALLQKELTDLVELDVSLATGSPKPLKLAPSVATVITADDIERIGATSLDDILETVPGFHVQPSSTNYFNSIWNLRGIFTQFDPQVLLLINGQPIRFNAYGARFQTFRMPVSMISRVEIIRGPGSALLGADAFAGAVNVITKGQEEIDGTKGGTRVGSFDTRHYWAQHGGSYNGWEVALGSEYQKSSGDTGRIIERDALGSGSPSLAPGPLDTHYNVLDANLLLRKDDVTLRLYYNDGIDNGLGPGVVNILTGDSYARYKVLVGSLAYHRENLFEGFDFTVQGNANYTWVHNFYRFFPQSYRNQIGAPGAEDMNGGLELTGLYRGWSHHALRGAGGFSSFHTDTFQQKNYGPGVSDQFGPLVDITHTPYVYMTAQQRTLFYLALQEEWTFAPNWELTAGVRFDSYSDVGSTVNPRIALAWSTTEQLTSKLMYGRGFRPPAFGELHFQNNPVQLGNPKLKPETIDTVELAFNYRPAPLLSLGLNLFYYRISGLIDFVADPPPALSKTARNGRDQEGKGIEVEADWKTSDTIRLRGNFSWQRSEDTNSGAAVPDAPELMVYADAGWDFLPRWSLAAQYKWLGARNRAVGDARPELHDYDLVNLTLRRRAILKHLDAAVSVRNLFDRQGREPSDGRVPNDFPVEGRNIWGEVRFAF